MSNRPIALPDVRSPGSVRGSASLRSFDAQRRSVTSAQMHAAGTSDPSHAQSERERPQTYTIFVHTQVGSHATCWYPPISTGELRLNRDHGPRRPDVPYPSAPQTLRDPPICTHMAERIIRRMASEPRSCRHSRICLQPVWS